MPPFYELAIASFRQSSSSRPRWAFAVVYTPASGHSLVYQITGSPTHYSLDVPQSVTLREGDNGYLGRLPVGHVDAEKLHQLHSTLASIPIDNMRPSWSSRDWVLDGITALRKLDSYHFDKHVTTQWVLERLG